MTAAPAAMGAMIDAGISMSAIAYGSATLTLGAAVLAAIVVRR